MLDRLSGGQQAGVEGGRVGILLHDLLAFIEDTFDGIALLAARGLAEQLEYLFQPFDLPLGLVVVFLESGPQFVGVAAFAIFGNAFSICFSA